MVRLIELGMLFIAILAPQFIMASQIDGDEFTKAGAGAALGGLVVSGYSAWKKVIL